MPLSVPVAAVYFILFFVLDMGDKLLLNYLSNNLSGSNQKEKFNQLHSTGTSVAHLAVSKVPEMS